MMMYRWIDSLGFRVLVAGLCLSLVSISEAATPKTPLTRECLIQVSQEYDVHPDVLLAILYVEGGTVGQNSRSNSNGSYDIGLFQINSMHLGLLKQHGISEDMLRNDGCLNARVAAWHLARVVPSDSLAVIDNEDMYLSALARYHSFTPKFNAIYAGRLKKAFDYMYANESK